jgi:predicted MFS family arabinose efflux permease
MKEASLKKFSKYQLFVIVILALTIFTVVLDFMVLSPLGAQLLRLMHISPKQFGLVVSAYAFSAGASGFLSAGFADRFDRKRMLIFFYIGFILGTLFCGIATTYNQLFIARIITGIFGGVISSISFAIITDIFVPEQRGRVMGLVQTSFAVSQVLGIPLGLYFSNLFDWHAPFIGIVILAFLILLVIIFWLKPVNAHLNLKNDVNPFVHFKNTLFNTQYLKGFAVTALLSMGGFLIMPFSSPFLVNNIKISEAQLPLLFMFTGMCTMVVGPLVGRFADQFGKLKLFAFGTALTLIMVLIYTNMTPMPFYIVVIVNCFLFIGVSSRLITGSALITMVPEAKDRGAFMGINSSLQQISGGIASLFAGMIVVQNSDGTLSHFNTLGYLTVCTLLVCLYMIWTVQKYINNKQTNGYLQ